MRFKSDRVNVGILLTIALVVFAVISWLLQLPQNLLIPSFIFPDASSYLRATHFLYNNHFYPDAGRPFGYPLFLGLPSLFGYSSDCDILTFSVFLNLFFWLASIVILYYILKNLVNSPSAFGGTLIMVFSFSQVTMIYQAMTETFFILIILLFSYFLLKYLISKTYTSLILSLSFLCFSVVVRPIGIYFAVLFLVFCLLFFISKKQYKLMTACMCIFIFTVGLQSFNMHRKYGQYTISYVPNYTLDVYLISKANYLKEGRKGTFGEYYDKQNKYFDSVIGLSANDVNQVAYWLTSDKIRKEHISAAIKNDKKYLLQSFLYNTYGNSMSGATVIEFAKNVQSIPNFEKVKNDLYKITALQNKFFSLGMLFMLTVSTIFVMVKRKKLPVKFVFIIILNLITAYFFFTAGISFWQGDRFSIVWYPLFIISIIYLANYIFTKPNAKNTEQHLIYS